MKACEDVDVRKHNISAVVGSHPWMLIDEYDGDKVTVPALFTTGSSDVIVLPSSVKKAFGDAKSAHKAFVNVRGAGHDECYKKRGGRIGPYMAMWFRCYLADDTAACGYFEKTTKDNMCTESFVDDCELSKPMFRTSPSNCFFSFCCGDQFALLWQGSDQSGIRAEFLLLVTL